MVEKIFISSTFIDLQIHRKTLIDALLTAGFHPIAMENFGAQPQDAVQASFAEVESADYFVGIYAWRYGYIPENFVFSVTHQEFLKAKQLKKPAFCFLIDEEFEWPEQYKETGIKARRLKELKDTISKELVRVTFTTPDDLTRKVLASLQRWKQEKGSPKSVSGSSKFQFGDIHANEVNVAETIYKGDYISAGDNSTLYMGDVYSGTFRNSQVVVRSKLGRISQRVEDTPNINASQKDTLQDMLVRLEDELEAFSASHPTESQQVLKRLEVLVATMDDAEPDQNMLRVSAEGLKKAAEKISAIALPVFTIASEIAQHILRSVH